MSDPLSHVSGRPVIQDVSPALMQEQASQHTSEVGATLRPADERTAMAYRDSMAAIGQPPLTPAILPAPQRPQPALAPEQAVPMDAPLPLPSVWARLEQASRTFLEAAVATPLRTGLTSGVVLGAAMGLAPSLGLTGAAVIVQTVAPYCALTALLQWLTTPPESTGSRLLAQRVALAGIGLPLGAAAGAVVGAALGLTGAGLLAATGGGAAVMLGACYLAHDGLRSPVGFTLLLLLIALSGLKAVAVFLA